MANLANVGRQDPFSLAEQGATEGKDSWAKSQGLVVELKAGGLLPKSGLKRC